MTWSLPYTICFCRCADRILMLYRNRPPNAERWNGLGGKIHVDETPLVGIQREVLEEAGIDLHMAEWLRFTGLVTWSPGDDSTSSSMGMYAFVAELPSDYVIWEENRVTPEGLLCWKRVAWICDTQNTIVVNNIPHFLPRMLEQDKAREYHCVYRDGNLQGVEVWPLPEHLPV